MFQLNVHLNQVLDGYIQMSENRKEDVLLKFSRVDYSIRNCPETVSPGAFVVHALVPT